MGVITNACPLIIGTCRPYWSDITLHAPFGSRGPGHRLVYQLLIDVGIQVMQNIEKDIVVVTKEEDITKVMVLILCGHMNLNG